MESIGSWWLWGGFFAVVVVMLAVDLLVLKGGGERRVSIKEAAGWSAVWVSVALLFSAALWYYLDGAAGTQVFAWAAQWAGLPLKGVLMTYSLGHVAYYFILFCLHLNRF